MHKAKSAEENEVNMEIMNMLPKSIYRLLPYFYIGLGLLCMLVLESGWMFLSSSLLIAAGGLVLLMRRNNIVNHVEYVDIEDIPDVKEDLAIITDESDDLLDHERRIDDERNFPIVDDKGGMIAFDRRTDDSSNKD